MTEIVFGQFGSSFIIEFHSYCNSTLYIIFILDYNLNPITRFYHIRLLIMLRLMLLHVVGFHVY